MAENRMLSDEILLGLIKANSGGGGGGTSNYNDLSNKPQIGGVTLSGNKSASDLRLVAAVDGKGLSTNDYTDADKAIVGGVTAALAGKQGALTAGNNIKIDNDTISVNRWAVPAGKVVYTVITSDENYGQNVHVQRHTLGGALIDDRTFTCVSYQTVNVDDLISIWNPYSSFKITLLEDSDEQQAGYNYTVNPITTPTSNSFTFMMEQEENANDLIIRSELDAEVNAIKDGTSIDSFADVETALATKADLTDLAPAFSTATAYMVGQYVSYDGNIYKCTSAHSAGAWVAGDFTLVAVGSELESKQNATDNSLQTTDKTVVGAVNELKSGLTNLDNNFTDVIGWDRNPNLVYSLIAKANINSNGVINTTESDYALAIAKVKSGNKYTVSPRADFTDTNIVYAFFTNEPKMGSVSYDGSRTVYETSENAYTFTAPITGYVVFRVSGNKIIQLEDGETATNYEPYHPVIGDALTELDVALSVPDGTGKNVLPMSLSDIKRCNTYGTWADNVYTYNGITFTVNLDSNGDISSIKATGTASAKADFIIADNNTPNIKAIMNGKSVTLNGCPANGSSATYSINGWQVSTTASSARDTGSGVTFNAINMSSSFNFAVSIANGYEIATAGLLFYPMVRLASVSDPTFAPYIPSVESRIEAVEKKTTFGEVDLNVQSVSVVGSYYGGAFYVVNINASGTYIGWFVCNGGTIDNHVLSAPATSELSITKEPGKYVFTSTVNAHTIRSIFVGVA